MSSGLTSTEKLVLVALAEHANPDLSNCYPSIPTIARFSSLNERTCRRALDGLVGHWFMRTERSRDGQQWRNYKYHLQTPEGADSAPAPSKEAADTTPAPMGESCGHSARTSEEGCGLSVQKVRTLCQEGAGTAPYYQDSLPGHRPVEAKALDRFPEFWTLYPRKEGKAKAVKTWKAQKLDKLADQILEDVRARCSDPQHWTDAQYIPHPATYLNQRRWEDEWKSGNARGSSLVERVRANEGGGNIIEGSFGRLPRETQENADAINAASAKRLGIKP